ncbi:MAG: hypothetical protein A2X36_02260 [Elusimicrobia bacterium GWA2_69_24]|nr:MAG: hypothetical protein A2X36_02260 [Elusimicrobia bacterium GWA2_69_24]
MPALNEEKNLRAAVCSVIEAAKAAGNVTIEIIIVNDGSTDGTAALIEEIKAQCPVVRTIHHERNRGFGACFLSGLETAEYERITLFPGDNVISVSTLRNMLRNCIKADLVCAYTVNTECRSRLRNILSAVFSFVYASTFNIHLRYINATPVYPVAPLRAMTLRSRRYSFPSETTVRLLRGGCSFMEIQGFMNPGARKSSALRIRNLAEAVLNYLLLVYDVYLRHREEYDHVPVRVLPEDAK